MTRTRQSEWAWEARATHNELAARHANAYPITRRRWRVEGTRAGNSRLLTHTSAINCCVAYGGKVVNVIPFTPLAERQAAKLPDCPRCHAANGKPCKSSLGRVVTPHQVRWELEA